MEEIAKNDHYEINVDTSKNRLYLKLKGFWKEKSDVPDYLNDIQKSAKRMSRGFCVLSDLREMKPPSQDIGALHMEAQTIYIQAGLDRTAEVLNSAVTKMSTNRYSDATKMKKMDFNSVEEAEKWLESKT